MMWTSVTTSGLVKDRLQVCLQDILCPATSSSVDSHPATIIKMTGFDHWIIQKYLCYVYTSKIEFNSFEDIWETLR